MNKIKTLFLIVFSFFSLVVNAQNKKQPNIVVILSDDVGFEEFGIYNVKKGKTITPNIDGLAEEGVAFKNCWAQAICGPSRAMFYSGNYAANQGAYDNKLHYIPNQKEKDIDQFPNFIKELHDVGYKTAVAGKWHNPIGGALGIDNKILGVDEYIVWNSFPSSVEKITGINLKSEAHWEIARVSKKPIIPRYWKPGYVKNGNIMKTTINDYGPDILSNYIMDFIKENANKKEPFLAFYPMVLAHGAHCVTPYEVANGEEPSNKHHKNKSEKGYNVFQNQIKYADKLVGKIWQTIKDAGIADNTILIFASDNGTVASAKGKMVDYAVHVPFVVAGAGIKQRGLTDELMDFTDVLPTLADFASAKIDKKYNVDGISLKPFLTGKSEETKDVIYSHPGIASLVRTKDYMLEAVSPLFGHSKGRFYKTNNSYDGRGYENITHSKDFIEEREQFDSYLQLYPSKVPTSFNDPIWKSSKAMKKGLKYFNDPKKKKLLDLPIKYQFYNASF